MSERWRHYLRFWGPNVEADIDDELQYHLDMCIEAFMARGMSREEARRAARDAFGDVRGVADTLRQHDRQQLRRTRRIDMFQDLATDVRYGLRQLRAAPRFTVSVILVLALGIGANTAIFSAIDAAFFRPLPFPHADRLITIASGAMNLPMDHTGVPFPVGPKAYPELTDLRADTSVFAHSAAYATGGLNLTGGAEPEHVAVTYVTDDFFATLGRAPTLGRVFTNDEFARNGPKSVILSNALWHRQFGADSAVIGRTVALNGKSYHVDGVMPADFRFPAGADLWTPLALPWNMDIMEAFRNYLPSLGIAHLAPGATPMQAAEHLEAMRRRLRKPSPNDVPIDKLARPLQVTLVGDRRTALLVLGASAALLLLIACANVTNLLLSRASVRQREIAVRAVLGATRLRIVRQLVVESFLLALGGSIVAILVALTTVRALSATLPASLAGIAPPQVDLRVLGFTLAIAIVTSVAFGLWPAFGASRTDLGEAMKAAGAGGGGSRRTHGARSVLAISEISLAVMLLVGAGLMIESLDALLRTDAGMKAEHVGTARIVLPQAKYATIPAKAVFLEAVIDQLRSAPGILAAGAVSALPMDGAGGIGLKILTAEAADDAPGAYGAYLMATPGYFLVMGTPLRGQDLPARVDTNNKVAVINETLAHQLWPHNDALGRQIRIGQERRTIIGVVADIRTRRLDEAADGQMYLPIAEVPQSYASLVVRGTIPNDAMAARLRDVVRTIDPSQPLYALQSMRDVIGATVAPRRTNTILLTAFGAIALLLSAVGVYAVLSYGVAQRTREIGIRIALGARRNDVLRLVLADGVRLSIVGIAIGLIGAFALSRYVSAILYEVSPHDPLVFIAAPLILAAVAAVATLLPALRATRVDPLHALRQE